MENMNSKRRDEQTMFLNPQCFVGYEKTIETRNTVVNEATGNIVGKHRLETYRNNKQYEDKNIRLRNRICKTSRDWKH
jgi:hypothetical protein